MSAFGRKRTFGATQCVAWLLFWNFGLYFAYHWQNYSQELLMTRNATFLGLVILMLAQPVLADKNAEKKAEIQEMRQEVLNQLYEESPDTRGEIAGAEGYGVFSNVGVNLIFVAAGGGSGVVRDNKAGTDTYMKMGQAGIGLGLGVKDFRGVFVFHTRDALDNFVDKGWDFGAEADAAAKADDKGGEGSAAGTLVDGVSIYQLTENGLVLQASLMGTKYWKNDKLN
jgi:lipid-binding SYLF domain-containing protein